MLDKRVISELKNAAFVELLFAVGCRGHIHHDNTAIFIGSANHHPQMLCPTGGSTEKSVTFFHQQAFKARFKKNKSAVESSISLISSHVAFPAKRICSM